MSTPRALSVAAVTGVAVGVVAGLAVEFVAFVRMRRVLQGRRKK